MKLKCKIEVMDTKIDALRVEMNERFNGLRAEINEKFNSFEKRFMIYLRGVIS